MTRNQEKKVDSRISENFIKQTRLTFAFSDH